ncbi:Panacea domain-containing protein [uncultured Duncaniella sp.]|uniref:Panacea domain-containing protein n=1 Tax=uncultured Duncaniella sp. TaxID=2768039 RepID=UPI00272C46CD|nr:type II toxin-antitoxin system antitoxin SocA domain-containing protein [uncultured Duncaniella sp.]
MAYNVYEIANLILRLANNVYGSEPISNMKLQKLLYYEQGYHLAYFDEPLFDEEIEAWKFGPVVPQIYDKYKIYHDSPILPEDGDVLIEGEHYELFYNVFTFFNRFSAFGLMEKTHSEEPWLITYKNGAGSSHVIPKSSISDFFKKVL